MFDTKAANQNSFLSLLDEPYVSISIFLSLILQPSKEVELFIHFISLFDVRSAHNRQISFSVILLLSKYSIKRKWSFRKHITSVMPLKLFA